MGDGAQDSTTSRRVTSGDEPAIDLADIVESDDPHAELKRLGQRAAVHRLPSGFVVVTGYNATVEVLHSPDTCTGPIASLYRDRLPPGAANDEMAHRLNFLDPPDHPRVRRVVAKAFTNRRVQTIRPWIASSAAALVDQLRGRERFDMLKDFAHELPSLVISELLGVPPVDRDRLTGLSNAVEPLLSATPDPAAVDAAVAAAEEMHAYLSDLIEVRRRSPGDDLLSALALAEDDGDRLSHPELLSLAATLYSAGHRTTRDSFANGLARLLSDSGEQYRFVVDGSWSVPATVRELLRLDTPTLYVARIAARDITIAGTDVAAGEPILVFLAAANRDPSVFERCDEVELDRPPVATMTFAHGAHYCLGASLATAEVEVMLDTTAARWPRLRLSEPPRWHQRGPFRGVDHLRVESGA